VKTFQAHKTGSWYLVGVLFKISDEHPPSGKVRKSPENWKPGMPETKARNSKTRNEVHLLTSQSSFFREIYKTRFFAAVKDINLKISRKLPLQTLLFSCLKFVSHWKRCDVKILEDYTEGNS